MAGIKSLSETSWIPAFAGMTLLEQNYYFQRRHPRGSGEARLIDRHARNFTHRSEAPYLPSPSKTSHQSEEVLEIFQHSLAWRREFIANGIGRDGLAETVSEPPAPGKPHVHADRDAQTDVDV